MDVLIHEEAVPVTSDLAEVSAGFLGGEEDRQLSHYRAVFTVLPMTQRTTFLSSCVLTFLHPSSTHSHCCFFSCRVSTPPRLSPVAADTLAAVHCGIALTAQDPLAPSSLREIGLLSAPLHSVGCERKASQINARCSASATSRGGKRTEEVTRQGVQTHANAFKYDK